MATDSRGAMAAGALERRPGAARTAGDCGKWVTSFGTLLARQASAGAPESTGGFLRTYNLQLTALS